jgi:hypothetical protein
MISSWYSTESLSLKLNKFLMIQLKLESVPWNLFIPGHRFQHVRLCSDFNGMRCCLWICSILYYIIYIYILYIAIGSMVLLYMVTWIPSIYPLYVSTYTSTMDPSWGLYIYYTYYIILYLSSIVYSTLYYLYNYTIPLYSSNSTDFIHLAGFELTQVDSTGMVLGSSWRFRSRAIWWISWRNCRWDTLW